MKRFLLLLLASLSLSVAIGWQASIAQQISAEQQFQNAAIAYISHGFRDPNDIVVRKLSVSSDEQYALASWNYLEIGGMTVLKKEGEKIKVLTHGGGAINQAGLEAVGIPTRSAIELLSEDEAR